MPELQESLAGHPAVILNAPPGSGKTTAVPPALLTAPWLAGKKILMLEPRRIAARLAAHYMAAQLGEEAGRTVGYQVRFEKLTTPATRIEVVTEGILTRRLQQDPELGDVGLVIFDEFHERSLQSDLALALCLDIQQGLRDDLKILIMSATLDTGVLSKLLGKAPVVQGGGRMHPVEIDYLPGMDQHHDSASPWTTINAMTAAVKRALHEQEGDILAFLPGTFEIRQTATELQKQFADPAPLILPLYGDLSLAEQNRAVQPDRQGRRRIILATPIAESSLTIEGVTTVIDCGLRRAPRFHPNSGLTRLETVRISRASANQRTGRAGRLGPGHCYRLWSKAVEHSLMAYDIPEILEADLCPLALELANWGVMDPLSLRWLDSPPAGHLAQAQQLLGQLEAIDSHGRISPTGKRMAQLPVHPRLAHMLIRAADTGCGRAACDLAALLSERDIIRGQHRSVDIEERLQALNAFRANANDRVKALDADPAACRHIDRISRQLMQVLWAGKKSPAAQDCTPGSLLFFAFPERLAQQRSGSRNLYRLASGRGARLPETDHLCSAEYLVVAELDAGKKEGRIFLAARTGKEDILTMAAGHIQKSEEVAWDMQTKTVTARSLTSYRELILDSAPLSSPDPSGVQRALLTGIRGMGLACLPWSEKARELKARIESMRLWEPEEKWPDLSEEHLLATLEDWLAPYLGNSRSLEQLKKLDMADILLAMLDWPRQNRLTTEAPTHLTVPSGSRIRLRYTPGEPPVLAVRLQEMFGLADTPRIAGGRIPVVLHLLSPAQRPIQITQDLKGFWNSSYHEVKKEMKGRYPKHHWPDDPWQALPTARVKKAIRNSK